MKKLIVGFILQLIMQAAQASDYYWVNGTGNWSDFSNHWATASGGNTFYQNSPQPSDNVFFDAGSFSAAGQTVTIDVAQTFCNNFSWQNTTTGTDLVTSPNGKLINVYGSVDIGANTNLSFKGTLSMMSAQTANTLNIQDTLNGLILFNNPAGAWTLAAPLNLKGSLIPDEGTIRLDYGTFNTGGYLVSCTHFISDNGSANRQLQVQALPLFRIQAYDYEQSFSGFPSASWEIDSLLSFGGTVFNLSFVSPFVFAGGPFTPIPYICRMTMMSGNQPYQYIFADSPDSINGEPVASTLNINSGDLIMTALYSDECDIWLGSNSLTADTIQCRSLVEVTASYMFSGVNGITVGYLEAPALIINIFSNSILPEIVARQCIVINGGLTFPPQSVIYSNTFGNVTAGKCFNYTNANGQYHFPKCIIGEDGTFNTGCSFDTLMLSPGFQYEIESSDTVTVNDCFVASGDPQHPIQLNAKTPGTQTTMIFGDSVCLDYVYLQDINASGPYVNAGANSIDISNNSGWLYTACSLVSNVWPGDANYDLIVNNADLLPIGIAWGETGPVRPNASIAYVAQPSTDWNSSFTNAVNKKHADCDGNGLIDGADTLAIAANYNMTHLPLAPSGQKLQQGIIDLYFQLPAGQVLPGTIISIPIMLGTSILPAVDFYGASFSITFDPAFVVPGSVSVDYTGSWMISPGNSIHMEKDFASTGIIDMALTRTDHLDVSGQGMIAVVSFAVAPNASGNFILGFANTLFVNHDGTVIPVNPVNSGIVASVSNATAPVNAVCFPNPFNSEATLLFPNPENEQFSLTITDGQGRLLKPIQYNSNGRFTINRSDLSNGIYFYELKNVEGTKSGTGKFVVY